MSANAQQCSPSSISGRQQAMTTPTPSPSRTHGQAQQPPVVLEVKDRHILVGGTYTNSTSLYGMFREWVQNPPNLGIAIQRRQMTTTRQFLRKRNKSTVSSNIAPPDGERKKRSRQDSMAPLARWKEIAKNEKLINSQKRDLGFQMLRQRLQQNNT